MDAAEMAAAEKEGGGMAAAMAMAMAAVEMVGVARVEATATAMATAAVAATAVVNGGAREVIRVAAAARRRWRLRRLQTGPLEGSIGTSPENLCWRKT